MKKKNLSFSKGILKIKKGYNPNCSLFCLILAMYLCAQEKDTCGIASKDTSSIIALDRIVVTATRHEVELKNTPIISFIIDKKDIEILDACRASEALEYVPGLDIECGTGVGLPFKKNISINGLPSFHNIVLVDGKRLLSSHFHTGANIDMVPPENIERVEIIKDGSSALYGSDALGGVINIITKKGGSLSPRLSYNISGGNRSTLRTGLLVQGHTHKNIFHNMYTGWEQSEGLPIKDGMRKDQLDYKQLSLMDKIDFLIDENVKIGTSVHYAGQSDMPWRGVLYDSWLFTPGTDFSAKINKNLSLSGIAYYSQWYAELSTEKNEIASPQLWLTYSGIPLNVITTGGEYAWRNFKRDGVKEHDQHLGGVFVQDEFALFDKIKVLGALRIDYVKNTGEGVPDNGPRLSPKLSILYRPIQVLGIRANVGRGFRAPYVQDLYESRYHPSGGGIWRYGNPVLKAENANNANIGIDYSPQKRISVLMNGYYTHLTDMIALVRGTRDSMGIILDRDTVYNGKLIPIWERANINQFDISGIELMASYRANHFGIEFGGSAIWQKSDDLKAENALMYPGQKIYGKTDVNIPIKETITFNCFIGVQHAFNRRAPSDEGVLDDYTNLEAGISFSIIGKYKLYLVPVRKTIKANTDGVFRAKKAVKIEY